MFPTEAPAPDPRDEKSPLRKRAEIALAVGLALATYAIAKIPLTEFSGLVHQSVILFHEAGHLIFAPFGQTVGVAGGTLGQLLMPLIAGAALLYKTKDPFGAAVCAWWFGASLVDAAVYAYDAANPVLPLIGGGTGDDSFHDFIFLFEHFGKLHRATAIAHRMQTAGILAMVVSVAAASYLAYRANAPSRFDANR